MGLYISFKKGFFTIHAINSDKLTYFLMCLHLFSWKNLFTALKIASNWFFRAIFIMFLKLRYGNWHAAIFAKSLKHFHECVVGIGTFD